MSDIIMTFPEVSPRSPSGAKVILNCAVSLGCSVTAKDSPSSIPTRSRVNSPSFAKAKISSGRFPVFLAVKICSLTRPILVSGNDRIVVSSIPSISSSKLSLARFAPPVV